MIPDAFSAALARQVGWPYEDVHAALRVAAEAGVKPEVAAQWMVYGGPQLVYASLEAIEPA